MTAGFQGWQAVAQGIERIIEKMGARATAQGEPRVLTEGQVRSLKAIANRLPRNGVILADEVGMGKTRIAAAVARAVCESGGRVALLLPAGLAPQWKRELEAVGVNDTPEILRSLYGYGAAWNDVNPSTQPWFAYKTVMISHVFANWRFGERTPTWRWALLPLTWAEWRKRGGHRQPWGSSDVREEVVDYHPAMATAARSIANAKRSEIGAAAHARLRQQVLKDLDGGKARRPDTYAKDGEYRQQLEWLIGIGFGTFDLVVVDEAHKSRGEDSGLSRLLENVVVPSDQCRTLALTATPVELGVDQWAKLLGRVGVPLDQQQAIHDVCAHYANALETVQQTWRSSLANRETFREAAHTFQRALHPFVLRRDKREDETIELFRSRTGKAFGSYRRETQIEILPDALPSHWLDAVIAAEGLSAIQYPKKAASRQDKMLRYTISNGHGIATILDTPAAQGDELVSPDDPLIPQVDNLRIEHWRSVLKRSLAGSATTQSGSPSASRLFDHPAILKAVSAVEHLTAQGRKVLLFGRFTRPMRDLEQILNARAMLRSLSEGKPWPQRQIAQGDEAAVDTAIGQLRLPGLNSRQVVATLLDDTYRAYELRREKLLEQIHAALEGLESRLQRRSLALLARAVADLVGHTMDTLSKEDIVSVGRRVINALSDDDVMADALVGENGSADHPDAPDQDLTTKLEQRLHEEYGTPRGGFARRMSGETNPHTRRSMQLKFNRAGCFPQVLIAQSRVGREGLNLHEECRDVILLHPEWNPGVVEQQIGRVDRLGSRWSRDFVAWTLDAETIDPPRIEFKPMMFKGTYDEHNWAILKKRWKLLRGQLHGIIIPDSEIGDSEEERKLATEVNAMAPSFSPPSTP
jgi:superfamily II DNA or RNA helicase